MDMKTKKLLYKKEKALRVSAKVGAILHSDKIRKAEWDNVSKTLKLTRDIR